MKTKLSIYSQPTYLFRTAIEREQKQFIKIAFAVHLSAVISAERYRSDSGALKSAVFNFVFFVMLKNKIEQSAKRKLLLDSPTDRTFENRRSRYKEPSKNKAEAYRVYVEHLFLRSDAGDVRIFSKEETGLYYYGARYLDPKYSRWLSGDPALNDYIPKAPIDDEAKKHNENLPGMGGVFNTVNLHVYHYAGNNPVKYMDPDGRDIETIKETIKISIDLSKQLDPLFKKSNPNNLMSETDAIKKVNDIKVLLTNMVDLAKNDPVTFVATLALEGFCVGIALDSGLVDLNKELKEKGIDIIGMNFSGSINLSSGADLKYAAQFQPNFGDSFDLGINLTGNLNKAIGDKHSLSFGTSANFTIPSKPIPNMQLYFSYKVQL
ncbi:MULTISPECIES: RHS repeat domain-containing protein [unclassified Treponema]|uniref:RHS repeat domain-containing protein n=1 Tax=unclassified Treponema TaxID=2638727 RepID=UPI0020A4429A|nr:MULTISPECIES: RHS repeat-associated core domain-containing protein [unclassified Treponema]